jgi:predicted GNAT family acetyltransferase
VSQSHSSGPGGDAAIEVVRNDAEHRYEARLDGVVVGFVEIRTPRRGRVVAVHTETDPAYAGRGIATTLVHRMLDDIRNRGEHVVPTCPFTAAFIKRHPDYADLVAPS